MAQSQPGATPSSPSPPTLNVSPTISKHASSYPACLLISHLLAAAINHLLFARGQIVFPVSTLQKRAPPPGARRDRKRDATLQALELVGRHVGAALSGGSGEGDDDGVLPLLVLFGPSALSPLEAFAISIRHPPLPSPSSSSPFNNGESSTVPPPPPLKKLLSTLEQRLVRFLIATGELQDALANTLRPTKMHLFVLRPEGWRAEGWKPRRGFRAQLGKVWGQAKTAAEEDDEEEAVSVERRAAPQAEGEGQPPQRGDEPSSSTHIGKGLPTQPVTLATAVDPSPASSSATATAEEDVGILSEALSPLKKRRRPPLVARTSSSYSSGGANCFQSPRASSAMLLKTPSSSKVVKTTATRHLSGAESVLWSPQPAAQMRPMDLSAALGARTSFEPVRSGLTLESSSSSDEERPRQSAAARAPPPTDTPSATGSKALNGHARSSRPPAAGVADERPPGSRLFPASSSRSGSSSSLLSRSRISSREKSSSASGVDGGGATAPTRSRPRTKLKGPKRAAFVIDCGGGGGISEGSGMGEDAAARRLGFESLDEKGCAFPGWQWFQCEVSVPAYLGS